MKKTFAFILFCMMTITSVFSESTKKRYTYFSTETQNKIDSDAGYWIYSHLNNTTNYEVVSGTGARTATNAGVTWDSTEDAANFDGESFVTITNPLNSVSDATGFSITCQVYMDEKNFGENTYIGADGKNYTSLGFERLFDLSDNTYSNSAVNRFFTINCGSIDSTPQNHMLINIRKADYTSLSTPQCRIFITDSSKNYYGAWHNYTLKFTKEGYIYTYIDEDCISYFDPNTTGTYSYDTYKDFIKAVLNDLSSYTYCRLGTSAYEALKANGNPYSLGNQDGFFFGKIRNYTFINTCDVFNINYKTGTSETFNSVVSAFIPDNLPTPAAPEGFTFKGWYTDASFTTAAVAGKFVDVDTTLYAKFLHSDNGTDYIGTSALPPACSGNWVLMNDITSGTFDSDMDVVLNLFGHSIETLAQTAGNLTLTDCSAGTNKITSAAFNGAKFTVNGLINIDSMTLGSGKIITVGSDIDSASKIVMASGTNGVVTSGFNSVNLDLGKVIFLNESDKDKILMKNKQGEVKIISHKSSW